MTETTEEKPGIDPVQKSELESMAGDFVPVPEAESEPIAGEQQSLAPLLAGVIVMISDGLARWRGDHWKAGEDEAMNLAVCSEAVMDKYAPDFQGGCEFTLISAALIYVAPRLMVDMRAPENEAKGGQDGDTTASQFAE